MARLNPNLPVDKPNTTLEKIHAEFGKFYYKDLSPTNIERFLNIRPRELTLLLEHKPASRFLDEEFKAPLDDLIRASKSPTPQICPQILGAVAIDSKDLETAAEATFWRTVMHSDLGSVRGQKNERDSQTTSSRGPASDIDGMLGEIAISKFISNFSPSVRHLVVCGAPPSGADFKDVFKHAFDAKCFSKSKEDAAPPFKINNRHHNDLMSKGLSGYLIAYYDHVSQTALILGVPSAALIGQPFNPRIKPECSEVSPKGWVRDYSVGREDEWFYALQLDPVALNGALRAASELVSELKPSASKREIEALMKEQDLSKPTVAHYRPTNKDRAKNMTRADANYLCNARRALEKDNLYQKTAKSPQSTSKREFSR